MDTNTNLEFKINCDLTALNQVTYVLSQQLKMGSIVLLNGDLGAGKTTLVQQFVAHQNSAVTVNSPTFGLIHRYDTDVKIYHIDLYRLKTEDQLYQLDIQSLLDAEDNIMFIEWSDRLGSLLPADYYTIQIDIIDSHTRSVTIRAVGQQSETLINTLSNTFK